MHQSTWLSLLKIFLVFIYFELSIGQVWKPDLNNGNYRNPIIYADYSDPDVIRVGDDFYMTASSFNCVPALPVLHSTDLVNWEIINYAVKNFPDSYFNTPQHGNGVWAPSIRFHNGWYYIYWGDPDRGIYFVRTRDPYKDWSVPVLVKKAFGNIDPCPLWDDDGKVYLVHAFANSRAGVSHVIQLQELNSDGSEVTKNRGIIITGLPDNYTLEGPKIYKRNEWYYVFAPAGGVPTGWQMVYRAKNIWGPYEGRKVLSQGKSSVNGPHQGGWIELQDGQNWFIHFQELQPFGRIVHLQPVTWIDDWPIIGNDSDDDGIGEPVVEFKKPKTITNSSLIIPQASDEFNADHYNLAWQWQSNYFEHWYSLSERPGFLRLYAQYQNSPSSLWMVPNILAQKIPGPQFIAIIKMDGSNLKQKEKAGLVILGLDYSSLSIAPTENGFKLNQAICKNASKGYSEEIKYSTLLNSGTVYLKIDYTPDGSCHFTFSVDNKNFTEIGEPFFIREGKWIGAKIGLFATTTKETGIKGYADFDWFRID